MPSQQGLYHDEDFNFRTKVGKGDGGIGRRGDVRGNGGMTKVRRMLHPYVMKKSIYSDGLNHRFKRLRVTLSALDAMERFGGFDEYILRTPPQELRSFFGEKMRKLLYYYMKHPEIRKWGLPARLMSRSWAQDDPWYARHFHSIRVARFRKALSKITSRHSPFYLPSAEKLILERQPFGVGVSAPKLNLWWKETPQLEAAFRRRLGEARPFERFVPTRETPDGYYKGKSRGGGGKHGVFRRVKSKAIMNRIFGHGRNY